MSVGGAPNAIRKTTIVRCDIDTAFDTWTERIDTWCPKGHSRSGDVSTIVYLDRYEGGQIYERTLEGVKHIWGQITAWEPPAHIAYDWYLGSGSGQPTRVDVHFTAYVGGRTRVDVIHRGPEYIGERWPGTSAIFDIAWEAVLTAYGLACGYADSQRGSEG